MSKIKSVKAWAIVRGDHIIVPYIAHTRREAIGLFEDNVIVPPHPQSSDPRLTIKDYPLYKPVKVLIKVMK